MDNAGPADSDQDMERRFRNAGVVLPADRAVGTYADGRAMLAKLHWLRGPRSAAAEPSNVFRLVKGT